MGKRDSQAVFISLVFMLFMNTFLCAEHMVFIDNNPIFCYYKSRIFLDKALIFLIPEVHDERTDESYVQIGIGN